jgi:hypothetical protein
VSTLAIEIAASEETGKLQVMHLKRYWNKTLLKKHRKLENDSLADEFQTDVMLLSALGLGLHQTLQYLYADCDSFEQFEDWIVETTGGLDPVKIALFNALFTGEVVAVDEAMEANVLSPADREFWDENGYVIIRNAVPKEDCDLAIQVICDFLEIDRNDPSTWYNNHPAKSGIMVQLFQHPIFQKNRTAYRIRKAYQELWGRKDVWVNTDRVGFNPPETDDFHFYGPYLHWDVSLKLPIPFGTQGILYLADTAENQGAFTLVPRFQNRIADWLTSLPKGANPRQQDIYALGPKPISANAGDFILWHHALPHGSSPNTSMLPRYVQYINYEPADHQHADEWI